ncbi:MAG: dihydrolipoamide acetyltransferase family protein [Egibacteraceae bacterium]
MPVDRDFLLPDLGEGLTEAEIVRWLVAVGDTVTQDQPVAEVETAKAVVEVSSPFAGTVIALHAAEGAQVQVGAPLMSVEVTTTAGSGSGNVLVGYGTDEGRSRPGHGSRRRHGRPAQSESPATAGPSPPRAKPPVRKLAKDLGVDLGEVNGSGPQGLVTRDDVMAAAEATPPRPAAERVPLRGVRRAIAEMMATSRREIPEATAWVDCDATGLCRLRERLNADQSAVRVSPLAIILRACIAGLKQFPSLNASLDVGRGEIVLHHHVNLGVATHTDRGLLVPVIRDAQGMSMLQIAGELGRLARMARDGSIEPTQLVGSTFTVSNYGSFGVDGGNPVINFPEAAILGVGRITDRPWVHKGAVKPRKVMQLSIAFDHRLCDGADAAGFLRLIADCVERPAGLLAIL